MHRLCSSPRTLHDNIIHWPISGSLVFLDEYSSGLCRSTNACEKRWQPRKLPGVLPPPPFPPSPATSPAAYTSTDTGIDKPAASPSNQPPLSLEKGTTARSSCWVRGEIESLRTGGWLLCPTFLNSSASSLRPRRCYVVAPTQSLAARDPSTAPEHVLRCLICKLTGLFRWELLDLSLFGGEYFLTMLAASVSRSRRAVRKGALNIEATVDKSCLRLSIQTS